MPEGDTVFHTAAVLHNALAGKTLTGCDIRVPRYATVDLSGKVVDEVISRGKHLFIRVGSASIHSHLQMDGSWRVIRRPLRSDHRVRIILGTRAVRAIGIDLGVLEVLDRERDLEAVAHLGPDLLGTDWSPQVATDNLAADPDRPLAAALLDQTVMAGVGNVYCNELCRQLLLPVMSALAHGGEDVLHDVVGVATRALGDRLTAAYALGSLAHGGFSPEVSDVDVALILSDPSQQSDGDSVDAVAETVRAIGTPLHSRLSIFWGTPEFLRSGTGKGRFPPLDRLCLFEHGRLLAGGDIRDGLHPPGRTELLIVGAEFALDALAHDVTACAPDPAKLLTEGVRRTTKVILFPVRFLFTADTGREGTNDAAVQHYSDQHSGAAAELVRAAFDWRTSPPSGEHAATLLENGFVPLYDHYLADHVRRLRSVGAPELADRFGEWRSRLLAAE